MFTLRLDSRAQDELGVPAEFSVLLEADPATIETVRSALAAILGGGSGAS
jgi:hypothetical protein